MKLLETIDDIILSEAIKSIEMIRKYEDYTKKPYVVEQVNAIIEKLKTLGNFIGTNKNGKRLYFTTDYETKGNGLTYDNNSTYRDIKIDFADYNFYVSPELYINGYAQDSSGRQVRIGKVLNMIINKAESEGQKNNFKELLKQYNQDPMRLQGEMVKKKKLIVMSTANYDIAGMTEGRSWRQDSCMRLDNDYGQGSKYVHCDILFGTIVVFLINEEDRNIENPLGRTLVKPYINVQNGSDVYYAADPKEYGGQTGFNTLVDGMFRDLQEGKEGKFKLHHRLSNQGRGEIKLNYGPKVIDQEYVEKFYEKNNDNTRFSLHGGYNNEYDSIRMVQNVQIRPESWFMLYGLKNLSVIDNLNTGGYSAIYDCEKLTTLTNIKSKSIFVIDNVPNIEKISGEFSRGLDIDKINVTSNIDLTGASVDLYSGISFRGCTISSIPKMPNDLIRLHFDECRDFPVFPEVIGGGRLLIRFRNISQEDFSKIKFPENKNYEVRLV
jgi:hypothetical protein